MVAKSGGKSGDLPAGLNRMISVEEARGRILAALRPTPAEVVALAEAWGRVTGRAGRARG